MWRFRTTERKPLTALMDVTETSSATNFDLASSLDTSMITPSRLAARLARDQVFAPELANLMFYRPPCCEPDR